MSELPSDPSAQQVEEAPKELDRRKLLPALVILLVIVAPVAIWAATSGGGDNKLKVDQSVSAVGEPEIVASVPRSLNTPAEANNKANVMLICVDGGGETVLSAPRDWPFMEEPGYPLPHTHQPVTPQQLQRIAKCRVEGTSTKLEGNLRRS